MSVEGQVFGNYRILRPLGAGGMGEILLARQMGLPGVDRRVVIKKVLPHLSQDREFLHRFLDETRVASLLTHGNIVQVYEVGEVDGQYFMAMEYVEGLDLREVLSRLRAAGRLMPEPLALYVLIEVTKALGYAHSRRDDQGRFLGIVHRDVSPANVLLAFDGQVKLADFGVAKAAARMVSSLPGTLHGKVYYLSPEQIEGAECDGRSDLFSLGVIAYEMLSGRRPFEGDSEVAVLDQVRRCCPSLLSTVAPGVPGALVRIVEQCLARRPSDRFDSAEALQTALTAYLFEAHTLVSAKSMEDFLAGMGRPTVAEPGTAAPAMTLEEAAARLVSGSGGENAPCQTRSVVVPAPAALPAPSVDNRDIRRKIAAFALSVALLIALIIGGLWAVADQGSEPSTVAPVAEDVQPSPDVGAVLLEIPISNDLLETGPPADPGRPEPEVAIKESPGRTSVSIRSTPRGATVMSGSRVLGTTPCDVPVPRSGTYKVEIRMDGYTPRTVTIGPESPAALSFTLERIATGQVRFRFFPADSVVLVDERPIRTVGNVVTLELPEGEHEVTLQSRSGDRSKTQKFRVRALEVTGLGTIELPVQEGP